jgi:predicted SprT family Zn-dependent metalloprotease
MNLSDAKLLAISLMEQHELIDRGWYFTFDNSKRRAGVCNYGKRMIGLSRIITQAQDEVEVRDTILHEIAHALVGRKHGHDAVWRAKAIEIGCNGKRCYDGSKLVGKIQFKYIGKCPNGHEIGRHRLTRVTKSASCPKCSPRYDKRYTFQWKQRS